MSRDSDFPVPIEVLIRAGVLLVSILVVGFIFPATRYAVVGAVLSPPGILGVLAVASLQTVGERIIDWVFRVDPWESDRR